MKKLQIFAVSTVLILSGSILALHGEFSNESTVQKTVTNTVSFDNFNGNETLTTHEQQEEVFVSDVIHAPFDLNAISAVWTGKIPENSFTKLFVQAQNSESDEWLDLGIDEDAYEHEYFNAELGKNTFVSALTPITASEFKYKVVMGTYSDASPTLDSISFEYFGEESKKNIIPSVNASSKLYTRSAWGADESIRVWGDDLPEVKSVPIDEEWVKKFADEMIVVRKVTKNEFGQNLTWPLEYTDKIRKITIHHTARVAPKTKYEALQYMRSIYRYHTLSRGWGDIGYHYVIDPFGNIYEGRAGGDYVVGAHVAKYNHGNIGIALMGNFVGCSEKYMTDSYEYQQCTLDNPEYSDYEITPEAKAALIDLLAQKTKEYNLDPTGSSLFRGRMLPNIVGHRDLAPTKCPGNNIEKMLPEIRSTVAHINGNSVNYISTQDTPYAPPLSALDLQQIDKNSDTDTNTPDPTEHVAIDYAAEFTPNNPFNISAKTFTHTDLMLKLENLGNSVWTNTTYLKVRGLPAGGFINDTFGPDVTVYMDQQSVAPEEIANFPLTFTLHDIPEGEYDITFTPMLNGFYELPEKAWTMHVNVARNTYQGADAAIVETMPIVGGTTTTDVAPMVSEEPLMRVDLGLRAENMTIIGKEPFVLSGNDHRYNFDANQEAIVYIRDNQVYYGSTALGTSARFTGGDVFTISSWERHPTWNVSLNDNMFRGTLEIRIKDNLLYAINELPMESYIRGVAEVSNSAPLEKQKAMAVIARTYAYYYLTVDEKYPGEPYILNSDPASSQKYLGYGYEMRSPQFSSAVDQTRGKMLYYNDAVVKTPYFSKSDGKTLSAEEVWGWTNTPYLQSIDDPLCVGYEREGHGVGLSGCGAEAAANMGKTYDEILAYYYQGIEIKTTY